MFHEVRPYVSELSLQDFERAADLDGGAHKKTGHKRSTIIRPATLSHRRRTSL